MADHADDCALAVIELFSQLPTVRDLECACVGIAAMSIAVLRGIRGDEFVTGYLEAAIRDKENIIHVSDLSDNGNGEMVQ